MTQDILHAQDLVRLAPNVQVERDVLNIVEWIRNYDPNLDVMFLDPDKIDSPFDAPYVVVEHCPDGVTRLVFSVWELDDRVKQRIYAADMTLSPVEKNFEEINKLAKKAHEDRWKESKDEAADVGKHLLANPKTTYTFKNHEGELVKVEDDHGVIKRDGRNEHE